jgi:regulator of ribonuclease activity A
MTSPAGAVKVFATCDLVDEHGEGARVIGSVLADYGGRRRFGGIAVTVQCFEDNSIVRQAIAESGIGRVLVIDGGGSGRCALLGDMLAKQALANGWEGLIIDGSVRDSEELRKLDIGVKARGTTPRKSHRNGEGRSGVDIEIAGIAVAPGDNVFADCDGIVILDPEMSIGGNKRI